MKAAYLLIFAILLACGDRSRSNSAHDQIESLDISPDDRKVLLLSNHNGATSVFEINVDGRSPRLILKPPSDGTFSNPRYSPDGNKIVFIKHFNKSFWESNIYISNSDGTGVQELTHGGELVTEAIFSAQGREVVYCSTKQYNSLKKKGTTDARKFDIYSINVDNGKSKKLSKLNAMGIDNLLEINEKYILFHMNAGKKSGIYSFEKDNSSKAVRIYPVNSTKESTLLDKPGYSPDRFLVFTVVSEMYAMNLVTRKADLIYEAKAGHFIEKLRGFHTKPRVLFKKFDEQSLTSLNADGTEVTSVDIEFPE